jgi:molybdopterin/thiamine biosynthesis adenylyltransferase
MDDRQLIRYSRHILLPQIDLAGQDKLLAGHVLLIGAGGLGSPAALYLAAAGVGRLTICDGDHVDLTNLQRQIVHREATVGVNKAESARRALAEINPDCRVMPIEHRVYAEELMDLVAAADVVVDACDNFATRHAVNRACVRLRKPLVSGAAIRFAGQLAVFDPRRDDSPCYHCLFPDTAAEDEERCATMGVFAPLTGMVGTLQAGEAIRLLLGAPSPLTGRLVLIDAGSMEWQTMKVPRDPGCLVCGRSSLPAA